MVFIMSEKKFSKLDFWKEKESKSASDAPLPKLNPNKGRIVSSNVKKMVEQHENEVKKSNEVQTSSTKEEVIALKGNVTASKILDVIKNNKEKQEYFLEKTGPIRDRINDLAKREAEEIRELQKNSIGLELSEYLKKEKEIRDRYTKEK